MVTKTKIEQVRKKIDKIDDQILELIQKRGVHAKEIGILKSQLSAKSSSVSYTHLTLPTTYGV